MDLFKSNNPVLKESTFEQAGQLDATERMTVNGVIGKLAFLLALLVAAAVYSWGQGIKGTSLMPFILGGAIGGFVLALIITRKIEWAPYLVPAYALAEGLFLGAISMYYEMRFPGLVIQAVGVTFGVFMAMLVLYRARIIRATERFKSIMFVAVSGIAIFYLIALVLRLFGMPMAFMHEGSALGIGISVVTSGIAALCLIMDFDRIEEGVKYGAPKAYEWFGAFGLLVTLVWLYLEIIRLLSKLQSRN
ncbi:putative YccA/Bax inhibitor family protein [Chitinophaga skermanii]|uniref:Putative YccA/Bax inhibitor family protein n=1 Tax=Chitinophaga skermanii TaxID=331697 RepID=A0A327QUB7_9BACT|nr:Bax inhibitor-1/YccA family protein [Chitinophaga skermanii]RAJ07003.1 putative YccA/Bax inhibitor family protein [Chitinophaga skermanii]